MSWFSKKRKLSPSNLDYKFQTVVKLVKDLDKRGLNCLIEGAQLIWQGYNKIGNAKTATEKELEDIDSPESILREIEDGGLGKE